MGSEFGYFPSKPTAGGDSFLVEDLLDFSHVDGGGVLDDLTTGNSISGDTSSSSSLDVVTPVLDTACNSSSSSADHNHFNYFPPLSDFTFSGDLCLPHDDLAELEWLSNFVDESFSGEGLHQHGSTRPDCHESSDKAHFYQQDPTRPGTTTHHSQSPIFSPEVAVPGKARSKRSRPAPGNWASRLLVVSQPNPSEPMRPAKSTLKKRVGFGFGSGTENPEIRRCLHCATEKTPQWRAGPMGPKTLCNACGVRFKSGRLVPEYRPAASPTFVQTKHSNSHRKVMELRRQKELMIQQQQQQQQLIHHPNSDMMFDGSSKDDYLIHQQIGSGFGQLM